MKFHSKVHVMSSADRSRFVAVVTGRHAEDLVRAGDARKIGGGGVVRAIQLVGGGRLCGGESQPFYREALPGNLHLPMLKRYDPRLDAFKRW